MIKKQGRVKFVTTYKKPYKQSMIIVPEERVKLIKKFKYFNKQKFMEFLAKFICICVYIFSTDYGMSIILWTIF